MDGGTENMIPIPNLDDEMYSDINDNAVSMISQVYPEWTDYNKHDAGITFIEMFSWFKEMQQYYLNQISSNMKEKYLAMLGMKRFTKKCAEVIIKGINNSDENILLPSNLRLFAENICFETVKPELLLNNEIVSVVLFDGEVKNFYSESDRLVTENKMYIHPFGKKYEKGASFEIIFRNKIPYEKEFSIYFSVFGDYSVKRNPICDNDAFIPLAEADISILTVNGWEKADIVSDETYCFLQSGSIRIRIPEESSEMRNENGFHIRFTLKKCEYDVFPVITEIYLNAFKVRQKKTLTECYDFELSNGYEIMLPFAENILKGKIDIYIRDMEQFFKYDGSYKLVNENGCFKIIFSKLIKRKIDSIRVVVYDEDFYQYKIPARATGFPYQEISLDKHTIMSENFKIMVRDRFDDAFYEWERKENFDVSEPESRHFVFDEVNGIIKFGNGERGLMPDDEIVITGCTETLAQGGNIKLMDFRSPEYSDISFSTVNICQAGAETEKYEDCVKRFIKNMEQPEKLVTFEDYEKCVYNTPGLMIRQCRAVTAKPFSRTNGVILIVQPYSESKMPRLSNSYIQNILKNTEKYRLIGTNVNVVSCQYAGIELYAEVCIKSHYINAYETIRNTVEDMFESSRFSLGMTISYSSVYHLIDALECVSYVKTLNITADGANYEVNDNGDIILNENAIAYLKNASYTISESR